MEGYGILQPRVAVSLPSDESTPFARMHGNEPGIDPYTRAISDVYQDFSEKDHLSVKVFMMWMHLKRRLMNDFPENRILSHDLLEGSYARCGLLSDVQLYEEYPVRYDTDMKRRHRWIRGDWQIASWILPWVPGPAKRFERNPISALSKWKIFDNLRRSLFLLHCYQCFYLAGSILIPRFLDSSCISNYLLTSIIQFFLGDLAKTGGCSHAIHI